MLDPQNLVTISGGIVTDPEVINDKILKLRIGVDYSASDKDSDNHSGYFDVTYYLKDTNGFINKNASFVAGQISEGKMKKGSGIAVIGRLVHERWKQDEQSRSRVVIVAEHLTYANRASSGGSTTSKSTEAPKQNTGIPQSF